jgi:type IV pilus assembly protein PilW
MKKSIQFRGHSSGVTLIELLVAMVIGLVLVATVIGLYVNTSSTRRQSVAAAEMNEDGLYALRVLSTNIRQAGYNPIQPGRATVGAAVFPQTNPAVTSVGGVAANNLPVFGCDNGFSNAVNTTTYAASIDQLTCNAGTSTAAIAVTFEADKYNTVPTGTGTPTDCLGNSLTQQTWTNSNGSASGTYYYAENRFFIKNNALYCVGNGGGTNTFAISQELLPNVEDIKFSYGTVPASASNTSTVAAGYLSATQVGTASGVDGAAEANLQTLQAPQRWGKVVTVRVCVLMRSSAQVLSEPQPYQGCDLNAAVTVPTDRYLRRSYITSVNLRNKISIQ